LPKHHLSDFLGSTQVSQTDPSEKITRLDHHIPCNFHVFIPEKHLALIWYFKNLPILIFQIHLTLYANISSKREV
jgi:hypothetical protein